jgi:tyrosyl-tRNA synthetase
MGKTAAGAVWLNEAQLSAYDYWQYWRNTEDADVDRFLKLFTILALDEIARLSALQGAEINEAKKVLATEATALLHGREQAQAAAETARQVFEGRVITATANQTLGSIVQSAHIAVSGLPTVEVKSAELKAGVGVLTAYVNAGLVASTSEARRQIKGGGVRVNDKAVTDEKMTLTLGDLTPEGVIKLSLGKKKHVLLKPV